LWKVPVHFNGADDCSAVDFPRGGALDPNLSPGARFLSGERVAGNNERWAYILAESVVPITRGFRVISGFGGDVITAAGKIYRAMHA
jgi:hypothetical protein